MAASLGATGTIVVGMVTVYYKTCSITLDNETQDITDTSSVDGSGNLWIQRLAGANSGTLDFTAIYAAHPSDLVATFGIGASISAACTVGATGDSFTFPGIVKSFDVKMDAKTPIEFHCTVESNGPIVVPS